MNDKRDQEWHAITFTFPREGSDWISHLLFELGSIGNLEEDAPDPSLMALKGYFPAEQGPSNAIVQSILELMEQRGIKPFSTYTTTLKIQNWAEAAEQMFEPIKILDDVTVISPWSKYKGNGEKIIVINPGMAFGTGYHATTRLAAKLMDEAIKSPLKPLARDNSGNSRLRRNENTLSLCDVGCGSAILSIIACVHGAKNVVGVEIDSDARKSAKENISKNKCGKFIKIVSDIDDVSAKFDIVVANILFRTIVDLKKKLTNLVNGGGCLILSGITEDEDERLLQEFSDLKLVKKITDDGWMGYVYAAIHD